MGGRIVSTIDDGGTRIACLCYHNSFAVGAPNESFTKHSGGGGNIQVYLMVQRRLIEFRLWRNGSYTFSNFGFALQM